MDLSKNDHLARAEAFTNKLTVERQASAGTFEQELAADQCHAMRKLVYHCTAAIVGALDDLRESVDSHGGA